MVFVMQVLNSLKLGSRLDQNYSKSVAALQAEATGFFLPLNSLYDRVGAFVARDLPLLRSDIIRVCREMQ
jgi:hypothetical protein